MHFDQSELSDADVEAIRCAKIFKPVSWFLHWLPLLVLGLGFVPVIAFAAFLEETSSTLVMRLLGPQAENIVYADSFFIFGLLPFGFAWMFFFGPISVLIMRWLPMPAKAVMFRSLLEYDRQQLRETASLEQTRNETTLGKAMWRATSTYRRFFVRIGIICIGVAIFGFVYGSLRYTAYTSEALLTSRGIIWPRHVQLQWKEAKRLTVGCNQTDEGGSIIYEVEWSNGVKRRLPNDAYTKDIPSRLGLILTVDSILEKANVETTRWSWLSRDPLHPQCLHTFRDDFGANEIDSLLRIGELDSGR